MIRVSPNLAEASPKPSFPRRLDSRGRGNEAREGWRCFSRYLVRACFALALLISPPLHAHEGHDHGDEPAARQQALAPRLTHASARLEVVALLQGHDLLVYADDYASNAPVTGLRVDVRSAGRLVQALEVEPGLYRADLQIESQAKEVQLDLSLSGEGIAEHFAGQLPIDSPSDASADVLAKKSPNTAFIAGGGLAALLLVIAGAWALRRRGAA